MTESAVVKKITEENDKEEIAGWFRDAKKQTLDTLPAFHHHLMYDYKHDYGTVVHAIAAGAIASCYALNKTKQGGITGFQAGFLMWDFVKHWNHENNKCGLRIIDYDDILYPQYENRFRPTISKDIWEAVKQQAEENLSTFDMSAPFAPAPSVLQHWKSIVSGVVPFGLVVTDD